VAPHLAAARYPVIAVAGRTASSARVLARRLPGARPTGDPAPRVAEAELILLAVPDGALGDLAARLAPATGWRGRTVLHHAGALGPEVLDPLRRRGASTGVLHPLQCLGDGPLAAKVLPGSRCRIEGTRKARRLAERLADDLDLVPLRLRGKLSGADRRAYHAAAALLSNDLVALLGLGAQLLQSVGLDRKTAVEALVPLALGTLEQAGRQGISAALSGPVVRGDAAALQGHLRALSRRARRAEPVHRALSEELLRLAVAESSLPPPAARRRLRAVLAGPPAGGRDGPTV
jgi:predicted short-subunit dehydrogenase-like oxidoreductase (DUF2520 family)